MNFFVYHTFNLGLVHFLCHNISNRIIDDAEKKVTGTYNGIDVAFYFNSFTDIPYEVKTEGYHIICREEAVKKWFFLEDMNVYQKRIGFPECLKYEYALLDSTLEFHDKKWILFWNFGENQFVHIKDKNIKYNKEVKHLKKLVNNTIFISDNFIKKETPFEEIQTNNLVRCLTNDVFMWNYYARITWANEFKEIYQYLNPPNKLCVSFRSPKPHRIEICEKLGEKNLDGVYISYSSTFFEKRQGMKDHSWDEIQYDETYLRLKDLPNLHINKVGSFSDTDFENLSVSGNNSSYMEFDYYFRILSKGKLQLLDETHSYVSDDKVPMNLSEKSYILLLANIPFISTHHYPLDLIRQHILDIEYPYYKEIKKISNNTDELVSFIEKLIDNFDEMYPKIKEWTNKVHMELQRKIRTENSFLEHMTTKI